MGELILEFPEVTHESMGCLNNGRLRIADHELMFKNSKSGRSYNIKADDVAVWEQVRLANKPALKLVLSNGTLYRFGNFTEQDMEKIKLYVKKHFDHEVEVVEQSTKGWNWGQPKFNGSVMSFEVDKQNFFEIPLSSVNNCQTTKNEVAIEFHQNDEAAVCLMEMRFHIPEDPENDNVKEFYDSVMSQAGIVQVTGSSLTTLKQLYCATPRGRYDFKMYPTLIHLRGHSFDYKIPISTILRLFLLPHKDGRRMYFVISLDPPIKQGQTRYHFLILEFVKEDDIDLELDWTDEQLKESKYGGSLSKHMKGPLYEVVSRLMKALVEKKITVPGGFVGHSGTPAIACAYKNASGLLYPLERGFMYVHKPPIHVRFEEISCVNFARSDVSTRSFDFEIETKTGTTHTFTNIEKEEYAKLFDFVTHKKLRCKNVGKRPDQATYKETASDSENESDADEIDPYKARLEREAKDRDEGGGSDESESGDEDYNPDKEVKNKSSEEEGSEPDEEYDSDAASSSGGGSESGAKKKPKKAKSPVKKSSKKQKESGSEAEGSDKEDEEGEESEPEVKKKKATKAPKEGKKAKREKKDPNAPKRAMTAYMLWLGDNREKIKKPGMSVVDVTKAAGVLWKDVKDKTIWENKAAEAKKKYEKAMAEYKKSGGGKATPAKSSTKKSTAASSSSSGAKKSTVSPTKIKSAEYVATSGSSSESEAAKSEKSEAEGSEPESD